ncbi:MAG: DUF4349 domain-containing protein [Actinomycetota bacterium]|nr:DUF4349 domain-containing protein [Actinomycetota bacterium]
MAETRRAGWAGYGAAGALLLLVLFLQGCGGGAGSQGGAAREAVGGAARQESAGGAESAGAQEPGPITDGAFDRTIVKTAELGVRGEDVRGSAEEARRVAERFGGEVLSSRIYAGLGQVTAELVLSVPSGEFEAALDELRGLGERVTTDTVEGQDVTEKFVDLESRERNLLAAEESLLALYDRAEDVEDTLTVERELTDIRGQIEEVQGRIRYLERRTATSEIVLHLEPAATAPTREPWSASSVAARASDASLGVLQAAATASISAVVFWCLVPPAAIGLLPWRWGRTAGASG